jgi:NAD-dependent SIR2 family protein deacetylase
MPDISAEIKVLLENVVDVRRLVFFVGAGVSIPAGYPLWGAATQSALDKAKAKGLAEVAFAYAREKYEKQQYYDVFEKSRSRYFEGVTNQRKIIDCLRD